jgi:aminoglycoside phosphotransferase (APT) family kinase protein
LSWWREYLQFASAGEPPAELGDAMSWLASDIPQQRPPDSLIWGDPRLGNVIFQGTNVAGIVDWEMAAIAPAEVDLAWFFALRPSRPELPGFLDRRATIERYEARLGRPTHDLEWYEAFALVRSTSILVRMQQLLRQRGDTDHFLVGIDPIPPRLRRLLAE